MPNQFAPAIPKFTCVGLFQIYICIELDICQTRFALTELTKSILIHDIIFYCHVIRNLFHALLLSYALYYNTADEKTFPIIAYPPSLLFVLFKSYYELTIFYLF